MNVAASMRHRLAPPGEGFHVASAGAGLVGALAAWAWLVARAAPGPELWASHAFGATLTLLFVATVLHHARPASEPMRRLDHASVFLAMAGVAAPLCVRLLPPRLALASWCGVAALATVGAALKLAGKRLAPRHNILAHLALLMPMIPVSWALPARLGLLGAALFVTAVGALTLGAVVDARRRPVFGMGAHAAFHVLALLASAAAFALVAL